jgi:spore coat polysaccharide biosynthesis protein SpsF
MKNANPKIVAIVQARNGSSRLSGKVLKNLSGKPLIFHVFDRLKTSKYINDMVLATTDQLIDDCLQDWASQNGITCFRGSESDVLSRYYFAATDSKADIIVRITGDDPFKDGAIIDNVINMLIKEELDFGCNNFPPSFPEGLDVEVFTYSALKKAFENSNNDFEKEHVTQYFYRNPNLFQIKNYSYLEDISYLRLTVDTQNDFKLAEEIYNRLYINSNFFGFEEILALTKSEPDLFRLNQNENRSTMYKNSKI